MMGKDVKKLQELINKLEQLQKEEQEEKKKNGEVTPTPTSESESENETDNGIKNKTGYENVVIKNE